MNSSSLLTKFPEVFTKRRDESKELENLASKRGKKPSQPVRRKKDLEDEQREDGQIPVSEIKVPVETIPIQVPILKYKSL